MSLRGQIISYLESKGWQYLEQGGEIRLKKCPFCGSTSRAPFSFDPEEGYAKCHRCDWKGGLSLLKTSQGDLVSSAGALSKPKRKEYVKPPRAVIEKYHNELISDDNTLSSYCDLRKLSRETVARFNIGIDRSNGSIAFPYYEKGELISIKLKKKKHDGSKFITRWTAPDSKGAKTRSTLFNVDSLRGNETVYIVEGEEDCMILDQAGLENVVSVPNGAQSCVGDFLNAVEPFEDIVICFDSDEAGIAGAAKLASALGEARCRVTELPDDVATSDGEVAKDVTDFARAGKLNVAIDKIKNAEGESPESIRHIATFTDEFRESFLNGPRDRGATTGFPSLDNLIGGRRTGEITVISGNTGSGKSTFCLNTAINIAATGEAVLLGSFEQTIPAIMRKMAQMISGRWWSMREDDLGKVMGVDDLDKVIKVFEEIPLYVFNVFGQMGTEEFTECVKYARRRLKVKTVILDHIHFMLKHDRADSERIEIDNTMLTLKQMTIERDLSCYVVAHPRKKQDENPVIGIEDFRGSSFISQVADNVLVVWRDRDITKLHPTMGRAEIHSLKCRSECGSEGKVDMAFSYSGQKFVDKSSEYIKPVWQGEDLDNGEDFEDSF